MARLAGRPRPRRSDHECLGGRPDLLRRRGDAHLLVAVVEDAIVLPHEDVAHDPEGPPRRGHVDAREGEEALARDGENVVLRAEGELLAAQRDREVGQGGLLAAVDDVLLAQEARGARLLGQGVDLVLGPSQQGGAAVDDGLGGTGHHRRAPELHGVQADLPVGLAGKGHVHELARVVALVDAAKDELALLRGVLLEVEGEDGLVDELLVDHGLEGRGDLVLRDALEAEAEEAVKLARGEGEVQGPEGDLAHLREGLTLHVDAAHRDSVLAENALDRPGAVLDLVLAAVLLVRLGLGSVVARVQPTRGEAAVLAWNPDVGGARVEDDLEILPADLDGAVELRVLEVANRHAVAARARARS
mmetsp:Transcript_65429/g.202881  ORF Transcript_65429/g.202881 Transcript_65429/m.202881 type:complete len:360 (-) Transcript_65429:213-1292(-)